MRARNTTSLFFGFRNKTADDRRISGFANWKKSETDRVGQISSRAAASSRASTSSRTIRRLHILESFFTAVATLLRPDPAHDGGSFGDGFRGRRAAPDRDARACVALDGARRHRAANAIYGCVDRPSRVRLPSGSLTQSRPRARVSARVRHSPRRRAARLAPSLTPASVSRTPLREPTKTRQAAAVPA